KKVKEDVPNANLVILGDGKLKDELKKLANELGVLDSLYFLGFQSNPFKFIAESKVFVLSSLYEGFPNALAEAMACGVPVVSTDCLSGPREIIAPKEFYTNYFNYELDNDRYGLLVPVFDGQWHDSNESLTAEEEVMANTLIQLLQDGEINHYFSKKSQERIQDFKINKHIKQWESLI